MTRLRPRFSGRRGSVLIVAMLLTALLALVIGSYLNLTLTGSRQTRRNFDRNAAFHLAEAGLEEAVWSYNQRLAGSASAWSGWESDGISAWRRFSDFTLTPGSTGLVKVYAGNIAPSGPSQPVVVAESTVSSGGVGDSTQVIEVTLKRRSFFSNGLTARRSLVFRGSNTTFDSWDSDPDDDPATPPVDYSASLGNDRGGVASASVENSAALINHARIYGYVSTGGAQPSVGLDGLVGPFGTAPGTIDPARVATDFVAAFPDMQEPEGGTLVDPVGPVLGVPGTATSWRTPCIKLAGKKSLTILGHVTLVITAPPGTTAIDLAGSASIIIPAGSNLTIYCAGDVKIAGLGLANSNIQACTFALWGTNTTDAGQTITLVGRGALRAVVYAPRGDVTLNGNGDMMGAIVARDIVLAGNAAFHYDKALDDFADNAPFGPASWKLLTTAAERRARAALFSGW